jgi:hypothetical protein
VRGSFANTLSRNVFAKATRATADVRKEEGGRMASNKTSKRELIDTGRDKRFIRRDEKGRFDEVADVGKSLAQDRRQPAKTEVESGQGDRGDQKRPAD